MQNRHSFLCLGRAVLGLALLVTASATEAQQVFAHRGVDSRVDYEALNRLGPWDDRNYQLTQDDLDLLGSNEDELRAQVPAFFRVEMRRARPDMPKNGPAQYPRSALQIYRQLYGGYLVEGKVYQHAERRDGRWRVIMKDGIAEDRVDELKFLSGEVKITSPNGAAESAIKVSPTDTDQVIAGTNGPGFLQRMWFSTDGGVSWSQSAALPLGGTCCDPTVDWSSDGSLAYTATLGNCGASGCQVWFYRSSDGGATWTDLAGTPRRVLSTGNNNDKEYIHVDQYGGSPFKDRIYATWHAGNVMKFAGSRDFGEHWSAPVSVSSGVAELGIGSDITTDKVGGVHYFWPAFVSQRILLRSSADGGGHFGALVQVASTNASFTFPLPSIESREAFVYVAADSDRSGGPFGGSVYAAWTDSTGPTSPSNPAANHGRIQVGYSRDGGATWTMTTPHETADELLVDRYHPWLSVAPDGSVHVIFYDTRNNANRQSVDIYHNVSTDGGVTWGTPQRVTARSSPNIANSFEFGDYNGLDMVMNDLIGIWTDNRDESGGTAQSIDVYGAGITTTPSYLLDPTAPGTAGALNTWTTSGGTSGATTFFLFGTTPGTIPVPGCPGLTVDIDPITILGQAVGDASGNASISLSVPASIAGSTFLFQAVELSTCKVSNLTSTTF